MARGWISGRQQERDHSGKRNNCAGCGHEGTTKNPLVVTRSSGMRVHKSHTEDQSSGLYGDRQR